MRKIFLIMIMIFSLSFFTGCSSSQIDDVDDYIMLSLDISSNGQVVQSIDFSLNGDRLNEMGIEETEKNQFILNLQEQVKQIRNEFLMNFTLVYIANPNEEYSLNKGLLFTNVTYNSNTDSVGFDMIFTSIGAWNYYHNTTGSSQDSSQNGNDNIFYSENISQGSFPFSAEINLGEGQSIYVGERYRQRYLQALSGLSFENEMTQNYNPTLIYNYSTYYSRLHSDADFKYTDSLGRSHHVWAVESQDLTADNKIKISSYNIHSGSWYLSALIFTTILGIILYVILDYKKIKESFKNRKTKKMIKDK